MKDFIGQNDFTWFIGVVEDRDDPVQLGRVRVRCFGWHTEDKGQIPTGSLPWAIPLQGITSPAISGVGQSPTGLVEGSWVVGFFLDGADAQEPVVMGSIASSSSEFGEPTKGFFDPNIRPEEDVPINPHNGGYPHSVYPRFIKESDVNRLARNSNTVHNVSKDMLAEFVGDIPVVDNAFYNAQIIGNIITEDRDDKTPPTGDVDIIREYTVDSKWSADLINNNTESQTWNEPKSTDKTLRGREDDRGERVKLGVKEGEYDRNRYHTVYPKNHVFESESGHIKEYDDTPYAERIHESHTSGTHYEIDADGNKVTHVVGNDYEVIMGTSFVNVRGDVNLTIDSNVKTYIKGDWDIQVDGNVNEHIKGNVTQQVDGNQTETVKKNVTEIYGTDDNKHRHIIDVIGSRTESVTNNVTETYGANQTTKITDNLDVDAKRIDLN